MTSTTAKKNDKSKTTAKALDAIALLKADHRAVEELFEQFEKSRSPAKKADLAQEICTELTIHAQVEEEVFYPVAKEALKDHDLVPEAIVEHSTMKDLIAQILEGDPEADAEMYDAKVKVLSEYVQHHVKEEEKELFPKVRDTKIDLNELGEQLQERKEELQAGLGE
jgi:hemerythrin superfamily protein